MEIQLKDANEKINNLEEELSRAPKIEDLEQERNAVETFREQLIDKDGIIERLEEEKGIIS